VNEKAAFTTIVKKLSEEEQAVVMRYLDAARTRAKADGYEDGYDAGWADATKMDDYLDGEYDLIGYIDEEDD